MITKQQVMEVQKQWGEGILAISKAFKEKGDYKAMARDFVNRLYAYDSGEVFFKPTLASDESFRYDYDGAISYFTTGHIPEDKGFAIKPWERLWFDDDIRIHTADNFAVSMGHYYGQVEGDKIATKLEFSFVYIPDDKGNLKIKLHHSSIPYNPAA